MSIVHNTLSAIVPVIDRVDPAHRLLALVQTRDALNQLIDAASKPAPKPKAKSRAKVNHQSLVEVEPAKPAQPKVEPFKATIRNGLIVVVFPGGREGYLANKSVLGDGVFGFSRKDLEWRASEKWVRQNKPEILAGLGLK